MVVYTGFDEYAWTRVEGSKMHNQLTFFEHDKNGNRAAKQLTIRFTGAAGKKAKYLVNVVDEGEDGSIIIDIEEGFEGEKTRFADCSSNNNNHLHLLST